MVASADGLMYRYEGDVHLLDPSTGWNAFDPCELPCTEQVLDGYFRLFWSTVGDGANNTLRYGQQLGIPDSLWVEWRFRSNHPFQGNFDLCDGLAVVQFRNITDAMSIYGDTVFAAGGPGYPGLQLGEFHIFRFESVNGFDYSLAVDGVVFSSRRVTVPYNGIGYLQIMGLNDCGGDFIPNTYNDWDFVRFGPIEFGESITSANPPSGFLDPDNGAGLDRFQVTFDAPSYVYIRDITVETTGGIAPKVIATRRREPPNPFDVEDDPRIVEIVLDRPPPLGETTRFIIDDGEATNEVRYTLRWADSNGDGAVDLFDAASLQNCFGLPNVPGDCRAFDLNRSLAIDFGDAADFSTLLTGPGS